MDRLKQYLKQHKTEMDVDLPPESVWQTIQAEDGRQVTVKRLPKLVRYAAAVFFITIGTGVWMVIKKKEEQAIVQLSEKEKPVQTKTNLVLEKKSNNQPTATEQSASVTAQKTPVLKNKPPNQVKGPVGNAATAERGYSNLIAYQIQRLRTTPVYAESPNYFTAFIEQLAQIDKDEQALKKDIEQYEINDQLVESLINIYQHKLNLLKSLQKEIKQMNKAAKENANANTLRPYYLTL